MSSMKDMSDAMMANLERQAHRRLKSCDAYARKRAACAASKATTVEAKVRAYKVNGVPVPADLMQALATLSGYR